MQSKDLRKVGQGSLTEKAVARGFVRNFIRESEPRFKEGRRVRLLLRGLDESLKLKEAIIVFLKENPFIEVPSQEHESFSVAVQKLPNDEGYEFCSSPTAQRRAVNAATASI